MLKHNIIEHALMQIHHSWKMKWNLEKNFFQQLLNRGGINLECS